MQEKRPGTKISEIRGTVESKHIEGKVRSPFRNKPYKDGKPRYEIGFNLPFRKILPASGGNGKPIYMIIGLEEVTVFIHRTLEGEWISPKVFEGKKRLRLVDVLQRHDFKLGDTVIFTFRDGLLLVASDDELVQEVSEFDEKDEYSEGGKKRVTVNVYERDPRARAACVRHFGHRCYVCGTDMKALYRLSKPFIQVHHLKPVAELNKEENQKVNPKEDMRPLCPNCHAVAHLKQPPYSIEELKKMLRRKDVGGQGNKRN